MTSFKCPNCGAELTVSIRHTNPAGEWTPFSTMATSANRPGWMRDTAAPPPVPQFTEATRTSPARAASVESDVLVPFLQAAICGGVSMIVLTPVVAAARWPFYFVLAGGMAVLGLTWTLFLNDHRSLLRVVEHVVNKDLDGDGYKGPPPPTPTVRVEYRERDDQHDRTVFSDLPTPRRGYAGLVYFAKDVTKGSSFSERVAIDHGYTRDGWQDLRDEFIAQGWATWNHPDEPRQGVTLLRAGNMVLRQVASGSIPREDFTIEN